MQCTTISVTTQENLTGIFFQDGSQLNLHCILITTSATPYGQNKTLSKLTELKKKKKERKNDKPTK